MSPSVWPFRRRGRRDAPRNPSPASSAFPSSATSSVAPPPSGTPGTLDSSVSPVPSVPPLDPLLRWKLDRWFDCLRAESRNGGVCAGGYGTSARLTFGDYELAALRVVRAFRHRPGSREHRRLLSCLRKLWRVHSAEAGPGGEALDREAFAAGFGRALRRERRALVAAVNSLCCALVDLADADGDSLISEREYRVLLSSGFRLASEHDLRTAYRTLDRDSSGALEHNEVHEAFVEFFTSSDPDAPGNWLLGAPRPARDPEDRPNGS